MLDVTDVRPLGGYRLEVRFSNNMIGERDFAFLLQRFGTMLEPLRDPAYFAQVFVDWGALTWPNGYDYDSTALYDEMKDAGLLRHAGAAE
jgi:Protein of unknown function (DUF2442)